MAILQFEGGIAIGVEGGAGNIEADNVVATVEDAVFGAVLDGGFGGGLGLGKLEGILAVGEQLGDIQIQRAGTGAEVELNGITGKDGVSFEGDGLDDLIEAGGEAAELTVNFLQAALVGGAGAGTVIGQLAHGGEVAFEGFEASGRAEDQAVGFLGIGGADDIAAEAVFIDRGLPDRCIAGACEGERVIKVRNLTGGESFHGSVSGR